MKERANAMLRITRIFEALPANAERRGLALDVWKTYGGTLEELKRLCDRERKAAQRDALEPPGHVPLFAGQNGDKIGTEQGQNGVISPTPPRSSVVFQVPDSIRTALSKCEFLSSRLLWTPEQWRAVIRATPGVDYAKQLLEAEAWCQTNPDRRPKKRIGQFMSRWFKRHLEDA